MIIFPTALDFVNKSLLTPNISFSAKAQISSLDAYEFLAVKTKSNDAKDQNLRVWFSFHFVYNDFVRKNHLMMIGCLLNINNTRERQAATRNIFALIHAPIKNLAINILGWRLFSCFHDVLWLMKPSKKYFKVRRKWNKWSTCTILIRTLVNFVKKSVDLVKTQKSFASHFVSTH